MRVEPIKSGFKQSPFVRISSDAPDDFSWFQSILVASYKTAKPFVIPAGASVNGGNSIEFRPASAANNLKDSSDGKLIYIYSQEAYDQINHTLSLLIENNGYQWIETAGEIKLLICRHEHGFT